MTRLLRIPRAFLSDVRTAVVHAPLEVLVGLVLAGTFLVLNHGKHADFDKQFAPMVVVACLVLPPLFGLSMLRALGRISPAVRWGASLALLAAAAAYAWGVFDPDHRAEAWRTLAMAGAGVFLAALVPAVGPRTGDGERMRTWRFWAASATRIVLVVAYTLVLYATLAGAIAAVGSLFDLHPSGKLYGDIAAVVFFALTPCLVVGGIPEIARTTDTGGTLPGRAVRLLGRFLYLPVVLIYGGILYAYTVRVLALGELPKNLLSPLVLFAALFALVGAVLLEPLRGDDESGATRRVMALAPALVIPLLPLAFRAVWVRQSQHGWTEFRYLRLALLAGLTILAVAGTVRLVRRRPPLLWMVQATLAAVLLVSSVGPWSAPAVSRRDQLARLRTALAEAGMLRKGKLLLPPYQAKKPIEPVRRALSRARYDRINGTVSYLAGVHGLQSLKSVIPQAGTYPDPWTLSNALPIEPGCENRDARVASAGIPPDGGVPGLQGGTLYTLRLLRSAADDTVRAPGVVVGVLAPTSLRVRGPGRGWQATVDLTALVTRLSPRPPACGDFAGLMGDDGKWLRPEEALLPLADSASRRAVGQLVLRRVALMDSVHGGRRFPARLTEVEGWVVVRDR